MTFDEILKQLAEILGIPLHLDDHQSCLLVLDDDLEVQIEPVDQDLLVGISLGPAPVGPTAEPLFRAALIENGLPHPRYGTLSWSRKSGELIFFAFLPLGVTTGTLLAEHLTAMAAKARVWKEAIRRGEVPQPVEEK